MVNKVLIIAHRYPPYEGVGARRWAKFAKHFSENGITVHVVTAKWKNENAKSWNNSPNSNLIVHRISDPFTNLISVISFSKKLNTKLEFLISKWFGFIDDAHLFNRSAAGKIEQVIKENNIKYVIATSPPYSSNYYASKLKEKHPELILVQDFRDTWIDDYFTWNAGNRDTHPTFKKQEEMEKFSINTCNAFVTVTPGVFERITKKITNPNVVKKIIFNGFDEDDAKTEHAFPQQYLDRTKFNISHFGTLAWGRDEEFYKFFYHFANLVSEEVRIKVAFNFYGHVEEKFKQRISEHAHGGLVKYYDFIAPSEVLPIMRHSDLHLVANDAVFYYAYGSKVFDAFLFKKPVLLISANDGLYNLIVDNNIGIATDNSEDQNRKAIDKMCKLIMDKKTVPFNGSFNYSQYSVQHLAKEYIQLLNSL